MPSGHNMGASVPDQALVASDGAASVSTLTGFDPSRMSEWATPEFRVAERRILIAMYDGVDPDFGFFPFKSIARLSGVPIELVRPLVRMLAQTGEAAFMRGLMNEDGEMVGSGYGLTEKGRERAHWHYSEQLDRELTAIAMEAQWGATPKSDATAEGGDSAGPQDIAQ